MRLSVPAIACCLLLGLSGAAASRQSGATAAPQLAERVDVARVVVDVHVLAPDGTPIRGLQRSDFRAFVDGREVGIERVRWTAESVGERTPASRTDAPSEVSRAVSELPAGRQIVLFAQRDLEPSRFQGLVTMLRRATSFLDGLGPDDRVAVVSMHSHLDLWTDYTADRRVLRDLVERRLVVEPPPADVAVNRGLSLFRFLDRAAGRRADNIEQALLVLARGLDQLPGRKSIVLFGFGAGRWSGGAGGSQLTFDPAYDEARRLLTRARAAVYCLDITDAAAHSLDAGLMAVAEDTGGFFVRTGVWPGLAMNRLALALEGRYELSFVRPDLPAGDHAIRIELVSRKGTVLARRSYRS